ncbi:MAG: VWA domain-containing protein [Gammaproteobacteria bacterium]|nr:VWA domain-containing protein [Gammaproteobacteria bacterium]
MITFAWAELLWLLPLPFLLRYILPTASRSEEVTIRVPFFQDIAALNTKGQQAPSTKTSWFKRLLAYMVWVLLVIAVARPEWLGEPVTLPASGRDLMIAVDISGSMEIPDMELGGQQVDRLTMVKAVAGDFIERRTGDRIGLILFGRQAYLQTPLTFDRKTVRTMLEEAEIGLAGQETAIGDGIGLAAKRLRDRTQETHVLILLTDGANTAGEVDPLKAAWLASQINVRIYTIGIGADEMQVRTLFGSQTVNPSRDLDEDTLKSIAKRTGGTYFRAKDTESLEEVYRQLDALEPSSVETQTFRPTKSLFHWPLGGALLLSLLIALTYCRFKRNLQS